MPGLPPALFILLAFALMAGCREDLGVPPPELPAPYSGITSTDGNGSVLSVDTADWKPIDALGTFVNPAFPNPCTTNFNFIFRLAAADSIVITLNAAPSAVVEVIASGRFGQGQFQVIGDVASLSPGIYRVYFTVVRGGALYTTYGDVQVGP